MATDYPNLTIQIGKRKSELLHCPFCGGEAEFITVSNNSKHTGVGFNYIIACSKCNCTPIQKSQELNVFLDKNGELKITDASVVNKRNMIDEWNTRTPQKEVRNDSTF